MTHPAIEFRGVRKSYGRTPVLDDLALRVERGESFGLVGLNGAGKTTLIKCLLDFCSVEQGSIEILGHSHLEPESRRPLAYLPERFQAPYFLTGEEFIRYLLALLGQPFKRADVEAVCQGLDLEPETLGRPVRTLSKGTVQKLGIAACLLGGREVFVLDEPLSGLDPKARALTRRALARLKERGCTVFLTSHSLGDVAGLCDRMAVLHEHRVRFCGTPAEFQEAYGASDPEEAFLRCIGAEAPRVADNA